MADMGASADEFAGSNEDAVPEAKSSRAWLATLKQAEGVFRDYQDKADSIDKLFANLNGLSSTVRDRQFQLFWSNIQVLGPTIYARPPIPVVVPKFKDRRPLYRTASELLERATNVAFDLANINDVMMLLRDDLNIVGRGVAWVRYETKAESDGPTERICVEHKDRKDWLCEPARNWSEVGWVAGASYLTKKEMRERFRKTSGDSYQNAAYQIRKEDRDNGAADDKEKAKVWEIWSKTHNRVFWVTEGCDKVLDEDKPHLKLEGFFPCPRPVYSTLQRRSLIPVPDMIYYKDQLEEINELTSRIHALADGLRLRGFYPAGSGEIGDAIETAIKSNDSGRVMVPISNWAAFGNSGAKDAIVWLPLDMVATTIAQCVELRRQVIDDVYQIMGLSDIMRGSTEKDETATAQQIKVQYGSVRIRDKQSELVRIARDIVRIAAEIMAENFDRDTLVDMSQLEIPKDAEIAKQRKPLAEQQKGIERQLQEAQSDPETVQLAQANPEQAQQLMQQAQQQLQQIGEQIKKLDETVTIEQVMKFLRDQKTRPFVLDIETDSTIQADEQAEKQARTEFVQALGGMVAQFGPVAEQQPALMPLVGEVIKFALAPYRAGRELEGKIDEAIEQMAQQASQPRPNPEAERAQAEQAMEQQRMQLEAERFQAEQQARQQELQIKAEAERAKVEADLQIKALDAQGRQQEQQAKMAQIAASMQADAQRHSQEMERGSLEVRKLELTIAGQQQAAAINAASAAQGAAIKRQDADMRRQQVDQKL